jgi:cysteine desulfurase family protein (TIGR01976 family)
MPLDDITDIRAHFPALNRVHNGQPVAYFDGPGGTQVPRAVSDAMVDYLHHHNANTHWPYPTSAETDAALEQARGAFGQFLNCDPTEVVFGANMTTLTLHTSRALARSFPAGAEIVVTELDHHANIDPWRELERDYDVTVRMVRMVPETGHLDRDDLESAITGRTALVAIGAASNAIGSIRNVGRVVERAHAAGALAYVDGVHFAPHRLPDVAALGADFFAVSAYKFYGPHIGALYGRRELLQRLNPPRLLPAGQDAPERFESGTLNHEGIVGAGAAVEWLGSLAGGNGGLRSRLKATYDQMAQRGEALVDELWTGLEGIPGVRLYGPPPWEPRTDTVAFTVAGHSSEAVASALAERAVFVSSGDFYATTLVERLGLQSDGLVRAGCAIYTTADDVARLLAAVKEVAEA